MINKLPPPQIHFYANWANNWAKEATNELKFNVNSNLIYRYSREYRYAKTSLTNDKHF